MLDQVVHQQAHDLELMDEGAPLIRGAGAVGIAVEEQPDVVAAAGEDAQRLVDVGRDGLRVDAPEPGIALGMDLAYGDLAACQQPRDPARARTPHGVDQDAARRRPAGSRGPGSVRRTPHSPDTGRSGARGLRPPHPPSAVSAGMPPRLAWMAPSTTDRMSAPAAAPDGDLILKPLSVQGLWDAVIITPHAKPCSTTSYEVICVGMATDAMATGMSYASSTSAAAFAKNSLENRRS